MPDKDYLKNRDIVLFGFQPWETQMGCNFIEIAFELSGYNRVLFVNRALDRITIWRNSKDRHIQSRIEHLRNTQEPIRKIGEQLWVLDPATILESINWIPSAWLHDELNFFNNQRLAEEINKAIRALDFSHVIFINDNDFLRGRYLKGMVHCDDYIFYLRDYMLGVKYFQRHGPRLEAETIAQSSLVVTNSSYLASYASKWNANSFDIGQGFRTPDSSPLPVPADIAAIKQPVIGYAGYISQTRIDMQIISYMAEQLPDCNIVLIGETDAHLDVRKVAIHPNVFFLGCKPYGDLNNYIQCFDICINPQQVNLITQGNYPRKIDDYLAMGKPVVATRTEAMANFASYTWLVTTREAFVAAIRDILANPALHNSSEEQARRKLFALTHTWDQSIRRLSDAMFTTKSREYAKAADKKNSNRAASIIRKLTICCLIVYLLFIYIKFIFF